MKEILIAAAVVLVAAGCGNGGDDRGRATAATPSGPSYVAQVNQLCDDLIDEVVPITGDSARPTGQEYLAQRARLRVIWDAFDAKVDAIEVKPVDHVPAEAFEAFRKAGDAADTALAAQSDAIATMDATEFTATLDKALHDVGFEAQRNAIVTLGMNCPAR